MSRSEIDAQMKQGKVPGIDMSHLLMTSYNLYSEEDRILYLILGLIQPDPRKRWGYGEIRCWCNNQHIPLVPKEGKVVYQYNEPFYVGSMKCWNYKQLTQGFAADSNAWTDAMLIRFREFAKRQQIGNWEKMAQMINSTDFNTAGKIFRCIYAMNPALDGFWWKGKKYQNTDALMREAAADKGTALLLSDILKNRCLSFYENEKESICGK